MFSGCIWVDNEDLAGSYHFCTCAAGQQVWQQTYDSPVVAIYSPQGGELRQIPLTSVASSTLNLLTGSSVLAFRADTVGIKATDTVFQ